MALKRNQQHKFNIEAVQIQQGATILTTKTLQAVLQRHILNAERYQIELAQVIEVVGNQQKDYEFGKIRAKVLYDQVQRKQTVDMIPWIASGLVVIPIVGQIVVCYKLPSSEIDVQQGLIFDQYYYVGTLNINNRVNNNIFQGVSIIHPEQQEGDPDSDLAGRQFYVVSNVERSIYKQGDTILQGRLGQRIKFTHFVDSGEMFPKVVIVGQSKEGQQQKPENSGTYICLQRKKDDGHVIKIYSDDKVEVETTDVEVKVDNNIDIEVENNVNLKASGTITIQSGNSKVIIQNGKISIESGGTIDVTASSGINLSGNVTLANFTPNQPNAFCGLPACLFTGAPHTSNIAIN